MKLLFHSGNRTLQASALPQDTNYSPAAQCTAKVAGIDPVFATSH
jgi:hypothetical protein|tara:strand:+ start:5964 stop:6098 length:135 start_codon:yes stop_codon:yes gene_type:complete